MIHTLTQKRVSFIFLFFVLAQLHPVFGQHQSVLNSAASASQSASLNASQSGQQVLFSSIRNPEAQSILDTYGQGIVLLEPDWNKVNSILEAKPLVLELALTLPDGSAVIAELRQVNLFGGEPETGQYNMSGKSLVKYTPGVYYRGSVKGLPKSVVSFSFFIHSLSGFVSLPSAGNIVIAPVKDILPGLSGKYVLYDDQKLFIKNSFTCNAVEQNEIKNQLGNQFRNRIGVGGGNCVRVYFECDYQLYLDHGSDVAAATNFVTAIFNEVATLYSNEAVSTIISAIFIWTSPDPYMTYTTSGDCLTGFQSVRTTYNGDIAHLLSTRSINVGGVAWLDVLCNSAYSYAYSNIYNSYASFPTYSWTVMVIAHEIGHNLGSNHTQWCGWTGGALDNCYTTEGGCAPGPAPATGGTIMSYCHLTGYGINFANGFGQQPGDAIRSRVSSAGCLSSCSCFPDVVIFAAPYSTICTGATVTFTATPTNGGTGPVYQWKKNGLVVGTNNPVYSTSSLANGDEIICEMTSNDPCAGGVTISSNAIIMSVNSNVTPSITISTGSTTICQGELATFGAIFNNGGSEPSFQWKVNGVNAGFDASSFSTSTLNNGDVVSCTLFSNLTCAIPASANSNTLTMTISAIIVPAVTITTPSVIICQGASTTFTAFPVNGGASPSYQWKVNGVNAGTNSSLFTTTSLTNGAVVSCVMTSNNPCASPLTGTSNSISMTVNGTGVVPTNGLLAWYPFNGNANDNSGNNFHGTPEGADLTTDRRQQNDNAYTFNGARDHIQIGSPAALNAISTGLTVSAWVYLGANNSSQAAIVSKWKFQPVDDQYLLWLYNKKPNFAVSNPSAPASGVQSTQQLSDSTWYLLVGTWDNTGLHQLYINGAFNVSQVYPAFTTINNTSNTDLRIGTEDSTYRAFRGKIDDVRIYNRVLTPQEIQILWNEGTSASVSINATASTICQGQTITFTASPTGGGSTPVYEWKVNGITSGTNSPVFVSSNFNSGDVVSCQMTSSDACVQPALAVSNSIAITVIPQIPQSVTISADMNPACPGEAITFTAAPSNGSLASTFQWKVNGTPVGNDTDVFVSPSLTNMDIVICEMTSLFPCVSPAVAVSNALTVSIVSSFAASVAIQADTTHVCQGTTVNFSALAVNGGLNPVYQWKVNGFVAGSNSPLFPVVLSNNDIVTCEMSSGHSCAIPATAVSNSVQVSVDLFVTPLVSITGLPVAVCYGDPVQFTPLPVFGGSSPLYEWYVNGIFTIATGGTYSDSTLSNQDQVYCVMTSNENCVTTGTANSNSVTVTVNAASVPVITETGGTLNSTVAVSYQWYFNSVLISGADNQSFTPPANGFYHVVITDANGCTASSALYQVTTVGIPEAGDNNSVFTLYPNPTGSNAILDITGKSGLVADLISVDGKVLLNVFNGTTVADRLQITIPCSTLANGVYFVRVIRDGGVCIKRLVVTR